jgi:phosphatidate cytidylyltransferase
MSAGKSTGEVGRRLATVAIVYVLLYVSLYTSLAPHLLFIFCAGLIYLAQQELYDLLELTGTKIYRVCGISSSLLVALIGYLNLLAVNGIVTVNESRLLPIPILALFFSSFIFQMQRGAKGAVSSLAGTYFGFLYVGIPISCALWIRSQPQGAHLLLLLMIATGFNDIGGYVVGRLKGRHKLVPSISPGKTWEGAFGGWFFAVIAVLVAGLLFRPLFDDGYFYFSKLPGGEWHAIALASLIAAVGLLGDLAESLLKRDVGVKDSGGNLTGHGGYLDMVDSLLFTTPLVLVYATIIA